MNQPTAGRLRGGAAWRARLPVLGVVVACVAGVCLAVTGAANPVSAVQFLLPGHWVYHAGLQSVFHVDGATASVDAQAKVPGDPGSQVVAGETSGFVVGSGRITEFGKSSLSVEESTSPPSKELPAGIETAGGPYLVYRDAGKVVRLGDPAAVISVGGPVGDPVATDDGTLWLPRTESALLCRLPKGAGRVSCPVLLPKGHDGALAVVGDRPVFVDTSADLLHPVENEGLGKGRPLGVDVPDGARLASTDVAGRVAILSGNQMLFVDTEADPAEPATVELPAGDYLGPVSTGSVVAVVDRKTDKLYTYDSVGKHRSTTAVPPESGDPRLTRGEDDRVYVDGAEGEHVLVVDTDGEVTEVPVTGDEGDRERDPRPEDKRPPKPAADEPTAPQVPPERDPAPPRPEPQREPPPRPQPEQEPEERPAPPPQVPASPPGAPTGVNATAGDATATVTWGPAPDNRSAITGYTVSWPSGSTTAAPGARSATINGLANGTAYVFTVSATNGVGTGPGVSSNPVTPVVPVPTPKITASRGADSESDACRPPDCAWIHVVMTDFAPNTEYTITGCGSEWGCDFSEPAVFTTNAAGAVTFDDIRFDGGGQTVWVYVDTPTGRLESNRFLWEDRGGSSEPTVNLTRGPATTHPDCGGAPGCAFMHIELIGFPPNTSIYVDPDSNTQEGFTHPGGNLMTDANGHAVGDVFPYAGVGETLHVNAHLDGELIRSGDLVWTAG